MTMRHRCFTLVPALPLTLVCAAVLVDGAATAQGQRINVDGVGVTEWEEWSFADKDWWAQVAGDQTRTQFTLGQGVVAIADPDEWDDRGAPNANYTFNTQLVSPVIDVSTATALSLQFASSWRPEGQQKASVDVIYNGSSTELFRWTSDGGAGFHADSQNELVDVNLPDPAGATELQLAFNLFDAGNNWWWAIDNVGVFDNGSSIFTEDFESVTLGSPIDEAQTEDPVYSQDGPAGWRVITDTYTPPVQIRTQLPHGPSITRDIPPQDPPLMLQVDPDTGLARLLSLSDEVVQLSSYSVVSAQGAIDDESWQIGNLAARNLDPVDGGAQPGDSWEVVYADESQAFEAFLNGGTDIEPGESLVVGRLFDPSVGMQDLDVDFTALFSNRFEQYIAQSTDEKSTAGTDLFLPVLVEYIELSPDGDYDGDGVVSGADFLAWQRTDGTPAGLAAWEAKFGASAVATASASAITVPEPAQLAWMALAVCFLGAQLRRPRTA